VIGISNLGLLFAVVTSVLFWGAVLLVVIRVCKRAAGFDDVRLIKIPSPWPVIGKFISDIASEKKGPNIIIKIIIFGVFIRAIMLLLAYMFMHIRGLEPTLISVFHSFNRWDAPHYLNLAEIGYSLSENGRHIFVVFFPLYPWLIRLVNVAVGNYLTSAYIVSFVSYLVGLCYLYHLVRLDFSESTAWWAVILISIFPHSFFFGAPHTESLFILTTTATLYYIRRHKWLAAGIAGAFASATRMVGVALVAAAAVEFVMTYNLFTLMKKDKWKEFFALVCKKGLFILIMFVGTIVYLFINWRINDDPFGFMFYQNYNWNNGYLYFGAAMRMQFHTILGMLPLMGGVISQNSMFYVAIPNILGFGFTIWMIAYGSLKRHNAAFIVYVLGYTFVSFSMAWLLSGGRYAAAIVPIFIFLADYVDKKPHRRVVVPLVFIVLLLPVLRMYVLGGFVM